MEGKRGCLKPVMFGCLALIVLVLLIVGVTALVARRGIDRQRVEDSARAPEVLPVAATAAGTALETARGGRVILDLAHGEFTLEPADPGEGLSVEARYDVTAFELADAFESLPDSTWIYRVGFRRTISGLQAMIRALLGGSTETRVSVFLPPEVPIELEIHVEEGGFEAELGGLWITAADAHFAKGGFSLDVDEPLREPMERLAIRGRMGGFEAVRLGNASPRELVVDCGMGGADVDLRGAWARDCDIRLAIRMGGMSVAVPEDVELEGMAPGGRRLRRADPEVPVPVLRLDVSESMGEIEIGRR